ncbi:hypothetical protein C5F52_27255 [Limnohabitans sp. TS-CS-82]|uniref:hypothetical protein n=1 Tax=Limnohabitans sp. TS-CS-82 TaxID=2094193 RepID=UPI000CF2D804|nr:hypothetical protein [Limnohabitans sp. TS-CS-82]PQA80072.1 hypothetical protein C5F52_27255 [Limnohabitans sp. TS-CS-82]
MIQVFGALKISLVTLTFMLACFQSHANTAAGSSTSSVSDDAQELQRTWLKGALMLPKDLSKQLGIPAGEITRIDKVVERLPTLKFDAPMPLALLVHGCFGIGQEQIEQAKLLTVRGYVAFMPSYYGRANSFQLCGGNAAGEVQFTKVTLPILKQRLEEVDYGLEKARALPFVDKDITLVSGHSIGGITVGIMKRVDVTAYVITGWGCNPKVIGRPPRKIPLLAIRFKDDPWLNDSFQCDGGLFTGRDKENTISLVLDGQRTHEVIHDPRAVSAFLDFVGSVVGFPDPTATK